jgi:peptide-methionine (R)-S-oxide reductase
MALPTVDANDLGPPARGAWLGLKEAQKSVKWDMIRSLSLLTAALLAAGCGAARVTTLPTTNAIGSTTSQTMNDKITKTDDEWKKELTPEHYQVLREKGTERAFSGEYWNTKDKGIYRCAGCGMELFVSDTKFDSGCGWPSFYAPMTTNVISEAADHSHFMKRTEVLCSKCGGHLGHVFDDGPKPTGLRYCINSASLKFEKKP